MLHLADILLAIVVAGLLARGVALILGGVLGRLRERARPLPTEPPGPRERWPLVSVIIPAKDEERGLEPTVRAVLASDYPHIEILVVDDGSTDTTPRIAAALAREVDALEVIRHPVNRGKAQALNTGLHAARGELVVSIDADSRPDPDCIRRLAAALADPTISGVATNLKVADRSTLLGALQSLEYVGELGVDQRALAYVDAITVVAGPTAGWRRQALLEVGGWSDDTLTEDTDLTVTLQRAGHRLVYASEALTRTNTPPTWAALVRQRRRWMFGNLQIAWKHRAALLHGAPSIRFVMMPNWWFINLGVFLLIPVWFLYLPHALTHWSWTIALAMFGVALAFEVAHCTTAHALDRERLGILALAPLQRLFWPAFLAFVFSTVVLTRLTGGRIGWSATSRAPIPVPETVPETE